MYEKLLCLFFKLKTAYDMRIRDWSSDVCSSDRFRALHAWPFEGVQAVSFEAIPFGSMEGRLVEAAPAVAVEAGVMSRAALEGADGTLAGGMLLEALRSAVRRGGQESVSTLCSRWSPEY